MVTIKLPNKENLYRRFFFSEMVGVSEIFRFVYIEKTSETVKNSSETVKHQQLRPTKLHK